MLPASAALAELSHERGVIHRHPAGVVPGKLGIIGRAVLHPAGSGGAAVRAPHRHIPQQGVQPLQRGQLRAVAGKRKLHPAPVRLPLLLRLIIVQIDFPCRVAHQLVLAAAGGVQLVKISLSLKAENAVGIGVPPVAGRPLTVHRLVGSAPRRRDKTYRLFVQQGQIGISLVNIRDLLHIERNGQRYRFIRHPKPLLFTPCKIDVYMPRPVHPNMVVVGKVLQIVPEIAVAVKRHGALVGFGDPPSPANAIPSHAIDFVVALVIQTDNFHDILSREALDLLRLRPALRRGGPHRGGQQPQRQHCAQQPRGDPLSPHSDLSFFHKPSFCLHVDEKRGFSPRFSFLLFSIARFCERCQAELLEDSSNFYQVCSCLSRRDRNAVNTRKTVDTSRIPTASEPAMPAVSRPLRRASSISPCRPKLMV